LAVEPINALYEPLCACVVTTAGSLIEPHDVHEESEPVSNPGFATTFVVAYVERVCRLAAWAEPD